MNRNRLWGLIPVPLVLLFAVGLSPTPIAGYNSVSEKLLRSLHHELLWVAVPLAIMVQAALFYATIKFHNNDDPKPTQENRRLEITWTLAVAVILLFVGVSSYMVLTSPMVSTYPSSNPASGGGDVVDVHVIGQNWFWTFKYPSENVTSTNTLVLPANRTVVFTITSKDLVHSVHIPALGVKEDAFPGRTNTFKTHLTEKGTYRLYCAEFCGTGHSKMLATVKVVSPEEYHRWLRQHENESAKNASKLPKNAGNASSKSIVRHR